jgi:Xaa-Pro aminopeptidase
MNNLAHKHQAVQSVAKAVLVELGPTLSADDTEQTIAVRATEMMAKRGIDETWYYACPAFVLLGSRSCLSISGRDYKPSCEPVGSFNLVTVDLSPMKDGVWGDCARSFAIEHGTYAPSPVDAAFRRGMEVERLLHEAMRSFVRPKTSFDELFEFANEEIHRHGFENLDFMGNVGHSIESTRDARRYIERSNKDLLGDIAVFTFEPHIRQRGGSWGFKHENIYCFNGESRVVEL